MTCYEELYGNDDWWLDDHRHIESRGERWEKKVGPPYWFNADDLRSSDMYRHVAEKGWVNRKDLADVCRNSIKILCIPINYDFERLVADVEMTHED